jgi:NAD(P)-dependent dehydrogenase (short-subunit alcohol dehydrogenase family)
MDASLAGKIVVVTGASRGLGRGIALGLGEAGATVYVVGRTVADGDASLPGSVETTAREVERRGGKGIAHPCDLRIDSETAYLFERVEREQGRLDVLVNSALGSPPQGVLWGSRKFWDVPISLWDDLVDVGLRSHYVAAWHAVPLMMKRGAGIIINVASHACTRPKSAASTVLMAYSVGKAGVHRLTSDMAVELQDSGITALAIWPPASRTEGVLADHEALGWDLATWRDPLFTGRVVAALLSSGGAHMHAGQSLVVTELASRLGVDAQDAG